MRRVWPWLVAALAIGVALAQPATTKKPTVYEDAAGDLRIEFLEIGSAPIDETTRSVKVRGEPFRATWRTRNLVMTGKALDGKLRQEPSGALTLLEALITGGVNVDYKVGERALNLKSPSLRWDETGDPALVTLTGGLSLSSRAGGEREVLSLQGSSGEIRLAPLGTDPENPLRGGTIQGPVNGKLDRTGTDGVRQTVTLRAGQVEFVSSDASLRFQLKQNPVIISTNDQDPTRMELRGATGTISLVPIGTQATFPVREAAFEGGVTLILDAVELVEGKQVPAKVTATADRLTYLDSSRVITLSGNVRMNGENSRLVGKMTADWVAITLDQDRKPVSYNAAGSPGTTEATEKPR